MAKGKKTEKPDTTTTGTTTSKPARGGAKKKDAAGPEKKAAPAKAAKTKAASPKPAKKSAAVKSTGGAKPAATATTKKPSAKKTTAKPASRKSTAKSTAARKAPVAPAKRKVALSPIVEVTESDLRAIENDSRELPRNYGETRLVLMVRDPEWVFAYWEIDEKTRKAHNIEKGRHSKNLVLRIHELNGGSNATIYDVSVNDYTSSFYIRVKDQTTAVKVAIGIYTEGREFDEIAVSRQISVPKMGIANKDDLYFADVDEETYHQIVSLSGGARIGERLGSDEFLRSLQERLYSNLLEGPFASAGLSSGAFYGLSSGMVGGSSGYFSGSLFPSSFSMFSGQFGAGGEETVTAAHPRVEERGFWLEVGVDVIVYGATDPRAKVSFMGRPIQLTPDGTFRFRMVLPDSTVEFPIEAESPDGKEHRSVKPVVNRSTEGDPHTPV